jgi:hypothetical protein
MSEADGSAPTTTRGLTLTPSDQPSVAPIPLTFGQTVHADRPAPTAAGPRRSIVIGGALLLLLLGGVLGALVLRRDRLPGLVAGLWVGQPAAKPVVAAAVQASPSAKPGLTGPLASSAGQPSQESGVIRSDDFSDPGHGLFPNNQRGSGRVAADNGSQIEYQWSFAYQDGALVGRIVGDPPGGMRAPMGRALVGVDKLFDDFAVELRGKIASSPELTRFGVQYLPTSSESISFTLVPGTSTYVIVHGTNQQFQTLSTGKTSALLPPGEDNVLRVEIRGDTARLFVNGQEVARAQHEGLARRGGSIGLLVVGSGPLENRTAEVPFRDFMELSLAP